MKIKLLATSFLFTATLALAASSSPALIDMDIKSPAPANLELDSYVEWVTPIVQRGDGLDALSAFTPAVFEWYEEEKGRDLPKEVYADPAKIFVNVDRPLAQTVELEDAGEIEAGNTVGAEVYAELDGTVDEALETMLWGWGKPLAKVEGSTQPSGGQFARRIEYIAPLAEVGAGAFANLSLRRDGGIVKDLADRYILLVRGDNVSGYTVVMQFVRPALKTSTKQVFAMATLNPLPNGKTAYKISTRFQGQSYKVLGNISIGRAQIGFNKAKVKEVAVEYGRRLKELKETGSIKDTKTDIEWGK